MLWSATHSRRAACTSPVPSTSSAAGSGLIGLIGLIGLRDRVQALGGSIEVNSSAGEGTAILVELPL
ncbi:MAG: hypothetical protein QOI36_1749, partial [Pseudonocardiales bacterium]|nr:hypothetical protein [Pseudonocardiales bacterium]